MIIHCVMLSKNCLYDGRPCWKSYMCESWYIGVDSNDHMLNYAVFDVVMEVVYLLIKTKHFGPYICTSAYILYHSRANNYIDNSGKWQKLHIWKTHFWIMVSTVTNGSQWMLVFKYIPQHLFLFWGVRHLYLMACLWDTFCSWNYTLLSYSDPDPFQLTGKPIWGLHVCIYYWVEYIDLIKIIMC